MGFQPFNGKGPQLLL